MEILFLLTRASSQHHARYLSESTQAVSDAALHPSLHLQAPGPGPEVHGSPMPAIHHPPPPSARFSRGDVSLRAMPSVTQLHLFGEAGSDSRRRNFDTGCVQYSGALDDSHFGPECSSLIVVSTDFHSRVMARCKEFFSSSSFGFFPYARPLL